MEGLYSKWPQPPRYDAQGNLVRPAIDWSHPPERWPSGSPSLRFVTEPNRVYRMLAIIEGPVCREASIAISTLVFHTLGNGDVAVEKYAPSEAIRERQIEYEVRVRSIGTETAQNVVVTDTLPDGVTFVSADPPPTSISGRTLSWNLGNLERNGNRTISVVVSVQESAPDRLTNVAVAQASNDGNPANNRAEATTTLVRTNVGVRMTATRMVRPGENLDVRIEYFNSSTTPAHNVVLTFDQPYGGVLVSTSRTLAATEGNQLRWQFDELAPGASGTITLRLRALREDEASMLPAALEHRALIRATQDADARDNTARAVTALLVFQRPSADIRMRIHSEFDPRRGVYRTDTAAFVWPMGETLYFTPDVVLRDPPIMSPPVYYARQRIVAWSFVGADGLTLTSAGCRSRETPPAAETEHADLSGMRGCVYRYRPNPSPTEMLSQGRLYWSAFAPESLPSATYGIWPAPLHPTPIRIQYAVLVELVETGLYDIDEDGRSDSVLDRRTFIQDGTYTVTLTAPRDVQ